MPSPRMFICSAVNYSAKLHINIQITPLMLKRVKTVFNNTAIGVNNTAGYFGALRLNAQNSYQNRGGVAVCWLIIL